MHSDYREAGERLKAFRDVAFDKAWAFAHALEMDAPSIHRYMRGESLLGGLKLIHLYRIGCNIIWYLTCDGSMFADNDAGRELAAKVVFRSVEK